MYPSQFPPTILIPPRHFTYSQSDAHTFMASQNLKHRTTTTTTGEDASISTGTGTGGTSNKSKRKRNMGMAKRGLRSLAVAVSVPLSLTLASIYVGSSHSHGSLQKPFWFLPLWALHVTCMASSFLMGLSAWLVWAEGGFHRNPTALSLYLAQLGLSFVWNPIVLGAGATRVGLVVCLAIFGALTKCYWIFKEVNPIAADLTKPCLAWAAFLSIVNLKLVFV